LPRELRAFDPRVQPTAISYEELRAQSLYPGRTLAATSGAFGTVLALALARLLESVLFEVSPSDTTSIAVAAATLIWSHSPPHTRRRAGWVRSIPRRR
jgi:hypothetical protein